MMLSPPRSHVVAAAIMILASAAAGSLQAQSSEDAASTAAHLGRETAELGEKVVSLARAMPAESWSWQPMEGVRSVGDVYAHVAADNYFVAALLAIEVPAESGVTTDGRTVLAYEENAGPRAEVISDMERSFTYMERALEVVRADPNRPVRLGPSDVTAADLWVRAVTHLHEHLGQAIAYARMNEVVPPWSR